MSLARFDPMRRTTMMQFTKRKLHVRRLALVLAATGGSACSDTTFVSQPTEFTRSSQTANSRKESPLVDTLARGLAIALADSTLRGQLRDDFRDSPYRDHALNVESYFLDARGAKVLHAVANGLGRSVGDVLAMFESAPRLQLVMERMLDRLSWRGTNDIVVYGSTLPTQLRARVSPFQRGFSVTGDSVTIPMWEPAPMPYIALVPIEMPLRRFGQIRNRDGSSALSGRNGSISNRAEELAALRTTTDCAPDDMTCSCDPRIQLCDPDPCEGGYGCVEQGGVLLWSGYTHNYCFGISVPLTPDTDTDRDGLNDDCELEWAYRFSPMLALSDHDEAPYREPYFSVAKAPYP